MTSELVWLASHSWCIINNPFKDLTSCIKISCSFPKLFLVFLDWLLLSFLMRQREESIMWSINSLSGHKIRKMNLSLLIVGFFLPWKHQSVQRCPICLDRSIHLLIITYYSREVFQIHRPFNNIFLWCVDLNKHVKYGYKSRSKQTWNHVIWQGVCICCNNNNKACVNVEDSVNMDISIVYCQTAKI